MLAIQYGDREAALKLITSPCINLKALDRNGSSALTYAVFFQTLDLVKILLEKEPSVLNLNATIENRLIKTEELSTLEVNDKIREAKGKTSINEDIESLLMEFGALRNVRYFDEHDNVIPHAAAHAIPIVVVDKYSITTATESDLTTLPRALPLQPNANNATRDNEVF
jgi:hypothetical protein